MPANLKSQGESEEQSNKKDNNANLNVDELINCFTFLQNGFLSNFVTKFK